VLSPLDINLSPVSNACAGEAIVISIDNFTDFSSGVFEWTVEGNSSEVMLPDNSYEFIWDSAGTYDLTLTWQGSSCGDVIEEIQVTVEEVDIAELEDITLSENNNQIQLSPAINSSSDNLVYQWTPSLGLSCVDCESPIATVYTTSTYFLTVSDAVNGCTDTEDVMITVPTEGPNIWMPNAFTPDDDGVNDDFIIFGNDICNSLMRVYNRWGEMIFESSDLSQGWDGTYHNTPLNSGVYVYLIYYEFCDGNEGVLDGNVTLIR